MDTIYVTGHRNPDTDSIVSAMAYASLQNQLGGGNYAPVRLGPVTDETQLILDRFGYQPPEIMRNVRTQVRDLDYDTPPTMSAAVTIDHAWRALSGEGKQIQALPVTDEEGGLFGMLTSGDIADFDMESLRDSRIEDVPLFSLLGTLEAQLAGRGEDADRISGEVVIALSGDPSEESDIDADSVVLCAAHPDILRLAIERNVRCIILCNARGGVPGELENAPVPVLVTPLNAYRASRMIYQAIPVERVCRRKNLVSFHLDDYIDDVREALLESRYRSYPILDGSERVAGTLSRYHLIRPRRKRVVLVDHNEVAQSVPGLEQADILAIIDHHRLADVQTLSPMYFRNEPVGATTTIVARMYQENGLMPSKRLSGLMAAAILADTVLFRSPTSTTLDRQMAQRLAHIAGVSLDELGSAIFSASLGENKSARDLFMADYKEFHLAGNTLAISQITCSDSEGILRRESEFLALMEELKREKGFNMVLLMVTDVLKEGTYLIYQGDGAVLQQAFGVTPQGNRFYLPGVVSRKKQIVPMLSVLWG